MRDLLASRTYRIIGAGVAMILTLVFGFFPTTSANTAISAGNISQAAKLVDGEAYGWPVTSSQYIAQSFTTGDNSPGYLLTSMWLWVQQSSPDSAFMALHTSENGEPGKKLYDLDGSFDATTIQAFVAPRNSPLAANTEYFLVAGLSSGGTNTAKVHVTDDLGEDSNTASGWSVDDERLYSLDGGTNWQSSGSPYLITIVSNAREAVSNPASGKPVIIAPNGYEIGQEVSANIDAITDPDGLTAAEFDYRWYADNTNGDSKLVGTVRKITPANAALEGLRLRVEVTFTDDASNAEELSSDLSPPLKPAPVVLVSKLDVDSANSLGEEIRTNNNGRWAQAFTTGDNSAGYTPTHVDVSIGQSNTGNRAPKAVVTIHESVKAIKQTPDNPDKEISIPGDLLYTLSGNIKSGISSSANQKITFKLPDDASLVAETEYFIVFTNKLVGDYFAGDYSINATRLGDANVAVSGWSIPRSGLHTQSSNPTVADWDEEDGYSARIAIRGHIKTEAVNAPATGAPTISGTARIGQTLTAGRGTITDADGLTNTSYSYQWIRVDGSKESNIARATSSTYQLVADDVGKRIKVKVSFDDDSGYEEGLTSVATSIVVTATQLNRPASGAPTISGTARVGQTLTADTNTIDDDDGLTNTSYSYQWIRVDGNSERILSGGTSSTYQLVADDVGKRLKVRVTFEDDRGYAEELTSAATSTVVTANVERGPPKKGRTNNSATGAPTISGTARIGQTLTAGRGTITDADGLTNVSYSYQWIRVDGSKESNIARATSSTYQLVADDVGKRIKVKVSFDDDSGYEEGLTSAATSIVVTATQLNSPASGAPTISGTARVGQTLTAGRGTITDADGLTNVSYSYQWIRVDGNKESNIASATSSTYRLVGADVGKRLKVRVTFEDDRGNSEDLTSTASSVVARSLPKKRRTNNSATGAPTISGTARVGQTLTADTNTIDDDDGLTNTSYSYQWIRVDGNKESNIASATSSTYRLVSANVGKRLKVRVAFEDDRGYAEELTSAITSAVATVDQPNSPATGAPIITSVAYIGQTLMADIGTIADADGLSGANYSYQWIRVDGSRESIIVGATSLTYRLRETNIDKRLKVRVAFEDDKGYAEELTSAATIIVTVYIEAEREAEGDPPIAPIAPDEDDNEEEEEEELELDDDNDNDNAGDNQQQSGSTGNTPDDSGGSSGAVIVGLAVIVIAAGVAAIALVKRRAIKGTYMLAPNKTRQSSRLTKKEQ